MITLLASTSARPLWRYGSARGMDVAGIFRACGLDPADLERGNARYPVKAVHELWHRLTAGADDPAVGLEIATHFRILDIQTLGVAFLSSSSLLTALQRLDRFERLLNSAMDHTLVDDGRRVTFALGDSGIDPRVRRPMEDARAAIVLAACREGLCETFDPIEVALPYARPEDPAAYFGFFRCPVVFGAERARLTFSCEDSARPFTTSNRDLAKDGDQVLQRALIKLGTDDVQGMVRRAIAAALPSGAPRAEDSALALFMSARTLQRKLAENDTSFSTLLNDVRRELAEQYVSDPSVPVAEISFLLGFSEVSAFARAFKRWTGVPPGEYRERIA